MNILKLIKKYNTTLIISFLATILLSFLLYFNLDKKYSYQFTYLNDEKFFSDNKNNYELINQEKLRLCKDYQLNCNIEDIINNTFEFKFIPYQDLKKKLERNFSNDRLNIITINSLEFNIKVTTSRKKDSVISSFNNFFKIYKTYLTEHLKFKEQPKNNYSLNIKTISNKIYILFPLIVWVFVILIIVINNNPRFFLKK